MQDYGICVDPTDSQKTLMKSSESQAWQKQERR